MAERMCVTSFIGRPPGTPPAARDGPDLARSGPGAIRHGGECDQHNYRAAISKVPTRSEAGDGRLLPLAEGQQGPGPPPPGCWRRPGPAQSSLREMLRNWIGRLTCWSLIGPTAGGGSLDSGPFSIVTPSTTRW